ncbi:loricrin-like [Dreissena polymorpha]|uniref:Uncharacterized protein n=1 Tax=Dreissena polymorpha TaxID=45954 RepID=A0A9D4L9K6_DREPO|nr:loricrin-like [Dreissena polymorpha]KAH3854512.1 hypothetical protein DPMN_097055 [Dreissena polymorpha]
MGNRSSRKKKQTSGSKKGKRFGTDGKFSTMYGSNRSDSLSGGDYGFADYNSRSGRKTCGTFAKNAGNTAGYLDADLGHGKGGGDCSSCSWRVTHENHGGDRDGDGIGGSGGGGPETHGNPGVGGSGGSGADQTHVDGGVGGGSGGSGRGDHHNNVGSSGGGGGIGLSHVGGGGGGIDNCHVGGGDGSYGGGGGGHSADHSHIGVGDGGFGGVGCGGRGAACGACGGGGFGGGGGGCHGGGGFHGDYD